MLEIVKEGWLDSGISLKLFGRQCLRRKKRILSTITYESHYGEDGNLNKDVSGGVRTCWASIVHEVRVLQGRGINVAGYIRLKLGNGENTRFWLLHEFKPRRVDSAICRIQKTLYAVSKIEYLKILEDIERGLYSKKPPIRRSDLNQYGVLMNFQTL
ncbi:hypothetical protein Tco_0697124 [Tanacetum coccineum]